MTPTMEAAVGPRPRSGFFNAMAVALLVVAVVGFAPTFFLRPFFDVPTVPGYVLLHGVVMTAWLALFLAQTLLIKTNRMRVHQRMGVAGMGLAAAVVTMGLIATLGGITRLSDADVRAVIPLVPLNLILLLDFALFTSAAFVWRRQPDVHKRLMLFASISLIGPAFARIAMWSAFGGFGGLINAMPSLFLVAIVVHDVIVRRRLHFVTVVCGGVVLASLATAGLAANSKLTESFVLSLR